MKKLLAFIISGFLLFNIYAQDFQGDRAEELVHGAKEIRLYTQTNIPAYLSFKEGFSIDLNNFKKWMSENFKMSSDFDFVLINTESDQLGFTHYRYQQTYKGRVIDQTMYLLHTIGGKVSSMNGFAYSNLLLETQPKVTEQAALTTALSSISAERYKWQMPEEEELLKKEQNNPNATYYPKAELVYMPAGKEFKTSDLRLAFKFNIYADEPISRAYYYIDATSGLLLQKIDIIHNTDTKGTAYTKYSGNQTITTDSLSATSYRLKEVGRGNGIQTFNLKKGTSYGAAVDFTDSDNIWDNVNANLDEAATDAHWGAEMTYDYFLNVHGRNSIDGNGFALKNYVHYSVNYANAFWDGQRMTFGDGNSTRPPFTVFDVIGHEITHGFVSYTASLGTGEAGALNESFADIFGTLIEFYGKPAQANWQIGDNIIPIRNMANPNQDNNPDTYFGRYWDSVTNETHRNSSVQSFWFYLLVNGGTGTNDLKNSYNVTGIGMEKADKIVYRSLTTYLTTTSDYFDARYYSIKAAGDLYGDCSQEAAAVMKAWYAVGIGEPNRKIDFDVNKTVICQTPFTAKFTNTSDAYVSYFWNFGDGRTSTLPNPDHIYTTYGEIPVMLKGITNCGINDSVIKTLNITFVVPMPYVTDIDKCNPGSYTLTVPYTNNNLIEWFDSWNSNTPIDTGHIFKTPYLTKPTDYFVQSRTVTYPAFIQPNDNKTGAGSFYNNTASHYLVFDALNDFTLKSVKVYSGGSTTRKLELLDSKGTVVKDTNIYIPTGESRLNLNFIIPQGTDYKIGVSAPVNLYRNTSGISLPITLPGVVSITGTTAGTPGFYYYLYNWEVIENSCMSERAKISIYISQPTASFTYHDYKGVYSFINTTAGIGSDLFWDFGDGTTSTQENPVHRYPYSGQYNVKLVVKNNCGKDSITKTLDITGSIKQPLVKSFLVYPNPTNDILNIKIESFQDGITGMILMNSLGKILINKNITVKGVYLGTIDLAAFGKGIYYLQISNGKGNTVRKIVVN